MNLTPIFSSFVAEDHLYIDNKRVRRYCMDRRDIDPGRQISNQGGWQSEIIYNVEPDLSELAQAVIERVRAVNNNIGFADTKIFLQGLWVNINNNQNYNEIHDHPKSFYSAVYYVSASEDQGDLMFCHPIPFISNYFITNKIESLTPFNSNMWRMPPKTGHLYIFPAYMSHFVRRNMTDNDRISVAFNFGIDMGS